jgi:hypothetical protein
LLVEVAKQDKEQDEEEQEGRKRKKQKATTGLVEWYLLAFITCIITFALSLFVLISFHNTPAYFYLHRPLTCTFVNNCISHSLSLTLSLTHCSIVGFACIVYCESLFWFSPFHKERAFDG